MSLICSSSKAANRLKPTSFGITSSHIRIAYRRSYDLRRPACIEKQAAGGCLPAATNKGHLRLRTGRMLRSVLKCSSSGSWSNPRAWTILDARGRSPMCGQVTSSALGLGAGGRSPSYLTRKSRSTRTKATTRVGQVRKPRAHLEQQLDSTVILIGVIGLPTLLACAIGYAMSRAIGTPVTQLHTNAQLARNGNIELTRSLLPSAPPGSQWTLSSRVPRASAEPTSVCEPVAAPVRSSSG